MAYREESDFATGIYRCKDPIRNFKIRVKLQQDKSTFIPLPQFEVGDDEIQNSGSQAMDGVEIEERTFSWQEKVFSPFELSYYIYAGNCHTPLEEKYHDEVTKLCKNKTPTNRLFTYTDADNFNDMEDVTKSITTDAKPVVTPLMKGMLGMRQRFGGHRLKRTRKKFHLPNRKIVDYAPSEGTKKRNHFLQTSMETLYILADLSNRESGDVADLAGRSEYVLCKVCYDSLAGVLMVTPDFTTSAVDGTTLPYHIEADGNARNTYCYWLEHASADLDQEEQDKEVAMLNKLIVPQLEILQTKVGSDFEVPRPGYLQIQVLGEVVSAAHFEYDHLFVHYFFELSKAWIYDSWEELSGVTHTCSTRGTGVANFCHIFETCIMLNLEALQVDLNVLPSWPQLFVEVLSLDSWGRYRTEGYGYTNLPSTPGLHHVTVSTWRPLSDGPVGEMRRFFIGGSPELEDPTYTGIPATFEGNLLSKYGMRTVTSGVVKLRLHIIHQSQALVGADATSLGIGRQPAYLMERLSAATLVNSVNTVLAAFKRARERMLRAREGLEL